MNKPIGATQQQLDDNNIEWVLCGNYGHVDVQEPKWALRCSDEYEWAKERTMLLQQIAASRVADREQKIQKLIAAGDIMYTLLDPPSPSMRTSQYDNALQGWDDAKIRFY